MQYKGAFPQLLKQMQNGQYTIKVIIAEENIDKTDEMYLANDIFQGFQFEQELTEEETIIKLSEHSLGEVHILHFLNMYTYIQIYKYINMLIYNYIYLIPRTYKIVITLLSCFFRQPSGSSYHLDNISQLKDETEEFHK